MGPIWGLFEALACVPAHVCCLMSLLMGPFIITIIWVKVALPPRDRTPPQATVSLSSEVHDVTEKESRRGEEIVPRPHLLLVVWKHQWVAHHSWPCCAQTQPVLMIHTLRPPSLFLWKKQRKTVKKAEQREKLRHSEGMIVKLLIL